MKYLAVFFAAVVAIFMIWGLAGIVRISNAVNLSWQSARLYHVTSSEVISDAKVLHLAETDSILIVPVQMNPNLAMIRMIKDDQLYFRLYNRKGNLLTNGSSYTGVYFVPPNLIK